MSVLLRRLPTWYLNYVRCLNYLQPVLLLVLRLYFGAGFIKTGWGKLTNLSTTAEYFADLGIPLPTLNAVMAGSTETLGGLCLFLGLGSRIITIPLIVTMLVAYATAHPDELHSLWSNPNLFLKAPPFLYLLTSLIVLSFGPGVVAVDELLGRILRRLYPGLVERAPGSAAGSSDAAIPHDPAARGPAGSPA